MFGPKHTHDSVAREIADGLDSGRAALDGDLPPPRPPRRIWRFLDALVTALCLAAVPGAAGWCGYRMGCVAGARECREEVERQVPGLKLRTWDDLVAPRKRNLH